MLFLKHGHYHAENCICKYNLQDIGIYFITNFNPKKENGRIC